MPKTLEQRAQERHAGAADISLLVEWNRATAKIPLTTLKDLRSKIGDVEQLAGHFDSVGANFDELRRKTEPAGGFFDAAQKQLDKWDQEEDSLEKELIQTAADRRRAVKPPSSTKVEDILAYWEKDLKSDQELSRERKVIFERWMKLDANYEKFSA
jgi:hypothetical protein